MLVSQYEVVQRRGERGAFLQNGRHSGRHLEFPKDLLLRSECFFYCVCTFFAFYYCALLITYCFFSIVLVMVFLSGIFGMSFASISYKLI